MTQIGLLWGTLSEFISAVCLVAKSLRFGVCSPDVESYFSDFVAS